MRLIFTSALAVGAFAATAALAQTQDDRAFLTKDVQGARYELALAKLADAKAAHPQVRSYARMIVRDHETANAQLEQLARSEGVTPPAGMTLEDGRTLAKIKATNGDAFDKAYLDEVTRINAQDATDSDHEQANTHEARIKSYLKKFSAMDDKHKRVGEALKTKYG